MQFRDKLPWFRCRCFPRDVDPTACSAPPSASWPPQSTSSMPRVQSFSRRPSVVVRHLDLVRGRRPATLPTRRVQLRRAPTFDTDARKDADDDTTQTMHTVSTAETSPHIRALFACIDRQAERRAVRSAARRYGPPGAVPFVAAAAVLAAAAAAAGAPQTFLCIITLPAPG